MENKPICSFYTNLTNGILILFLFLTSNTEAQIITTFAGTGVAGYSGDGGPATSAKFNHPCDVFKDVTGNIYIADKANNRIRRVDTFGIVSTVVGNGVAGYSGDGGMALAASLNGPNRVVVDKSGNIYIAEQHSSVIRKVNASDIISTIAGTGVGGFSGDGSAATNAQLFSPTGVAIDTTGNVYISDSGNNRIRKINTSGIISTYAGGGATGFITDGTPATALSLCTQRYVSVDDAGTVYFTNQNCWHFLKVNTDGLVYNVAGNISPSYSGDGGPADSANVMSPFGICPDNLGNVYLCPNGNVRVRRVDALNYITTVAGTGVSGYSGDGGPAVNAEISNEIYGIYADNRGNIYIADVGNNVIRSFTVPSYTDTICVGTSIVLNGITGGGTWSNSNTATAVLDTLSGAVKGISAGTAIITHNAIIPEIFIITVGALPVITTDISQVTCFGANNGSISVKVLGGSGHFQYAWLNSGFSPTISDLAPGAYFFLLKDSTTRCIVTDTFQITGPDSLNISARIKDDVCNAGNGSINTAVSGGIAPYHYLWSDNDTGSGLQHLYAGDYILVVTDTNGCAAALSLAVKEDTCSDIIVHDVITPNGDGYNDTWVIEGVENYPNNSVQVFDKWGDVVYSKAHYNNDWRGRGNTGELPDGTYYYLVTLNARNAAGGKDIFTGSLLLKR